MSAATLMLTPPEQVTSSSASDVTMRLKIMSASSRAEVLTAWRTLENEVRNQRLTCSSLWTETWLKHFGSIVPHQFALGIRNGSVCGIALLTEGVSQSAGPFSLRTRHLGTAGEPDSESVCVEYNSLLCDPADTAQFSQLLWDWIQQKTTCDELRLDGFDSESIEAFLLKNPGSLVERKSSYFVDLKSIRESGEEPIMRLGSRTRSKIRRTLRDLADARGEWAESVTRAEELFHQMKQLHQAHWTSCGYPGVYASQRFADFHLDLLHRALPQRKMGLFGVTAGGRLIGCCQVLMDRQRVLLYQCGRAPAEGQISNGVALDYLCICEALRRGYDAIDFLAGETEHKRRLSTNRAELAWVTWRRPTFKNRAIDTLRRIKEVTSRLGQSIGFTRPVAAPLTSEDETLPKNTI